MDTAIEILGYGVIVPAAVSLAVFYLSRRFLPVAAAGRYPAALALAMGFFVGYALLPSWAPLVPTRHWHWLPYLGAAAMVVGPIGLAAGVSAPERWLLHLLLAVAAAWLLVPTWASLDPPRHIYVAILTAYLFLLTALLDLLPARLLGPLFPALLVLASATVAVLLALAVSLKLGQVAGISTAAMLGVCLATFSRPSAIMSRGLIPVFALLMAGVAFVGCIEPEQPLVALVVAPAAPLALWAFAWSPLARLGVKASAAAQVAAVLLPLAAATLYVALRNGPAPGDGY